MSARIAAVLLLFTLASGTDYFPITAGNTWTYRPPSYYQNYQNTRLTFTFSRDTMVDSRQLFLYEGSGIMMGFMVTGVEYFLDSGEQVFRMTTEEPDPDSLEKYMEHHLVEGMKWPTPSGDTLIVERIGEMSVPAGTFDDVMVVRKRTDGVRTFYAPDVGMIQQFSLSGGDTINNLLLESYSVEVSIRNRPVAPPPVSNPSKYAPRCFFGGMRRDFPAAKVHGRFSILGRACNGRTGSDGFFLVQP
jgi:hypothetical protein